MGILSKKKQISPVPDAPENRNTTSMDTPEGVVIDTKSTSIAITLNPPLHKAFGTPVPTSESTAKDVRTWLASWFDTHGIDEFTIDPYVVLANLPWTGKSVLRLSMEEMESQLVLVGLDPSIVELLVRDLVAAIDLDDEIKYTQAYIDKPRINDSRNKLLPSPAIVLAMISLSLAIRGLDISLGTEGYASFILSLLFVPLIAHFASTAGQKELFIVDERVKVVVVPNEDYVISEVMKQK